MTWSKKDRLAKDILRKIDELNAKMSEEEQAFIYHLSSLKECKKRRRDLERIITKLKMQHQAIISER